jgi:hypothetical protein
MFNHLDEPCDDNCANGLDKNCTRKEPSVYVKGLQHGSSSCDKCMFVVTAFLTDKGRMEYERLYEKGAFFNKTLSR